VSGRYQVSGCGPPDEHELRDVSDHQDRNIQGRDQIAHSELGRDFWQTDTNGMNIVHQEIHGSDHIEADDEKPEQESHAERHEGQHRQKARRQIAPRSRCCEARWNGGTKQPWKDENQAEEAEAVKGGDRPARVGYVHASQPGPEIDTEAQQPSNIPQDQLDIEYESWRHSALQVA